MLDHKFNWECHNDKLGGILTSDYPNEGLNILKVNIVSH